MSNNEEEENEGVDGSHARHGLYGYHDHGGLGEGNDSNTLTKTKTMTYNSNDYMYDECLCKEKGEWRQLFKKNAHPG
jgi:hypothetical protein